jgi:hypothetical protein
MEKEKNMISFKFSEKGSPVIEIGDLGVMSFSKLTSHDRKGYRYLCFSHVYNDKVSVKSGTDRKIISIPTNDSYMCNMRLERKTKTKTTKAVGLPHKALPGRMKDYLKNIFEPYIDEDGYISRKNILKIQKKLNGKNINKILGKVQKPRKKRKKKSI